MTHKGQATHQANYNIHTANQHQHHYPHSLTIQTNNTTHPTYHNQTLASLNNQYLLWRWPVGDLQQSHSAYGCKPTLAIKKKKQHLNMIQLHSNRSVYFVRLTTETKGFPPLMSLVFGYLNCSCNIFYLLFLFLSGQVDKVKSDFSFNTTFNVFPLVCFVFLLHWALRSWGDILGFLSARWLEYMFDFQV
jgi:hypothetical protein